jgi:FtsH-binding integral membrane protein
MNDTNTTPRNIPRSIGAVLAGFVAVFVLSLGTDQLFHALDVYPPWDVPMTDTGLLMLALTYRLIYGIAGGYIVAHLAPRNPMRHALIMGGIGFVLSTAGGIAMWDMGAHWYPVALALSAIPCAWAGAALQQRRHLAD